MARKKPGMKDLIKKGSPKLPENEVKEIGQRVWQRLSALMEEHKDELAVRSLSGDGWNQAPKLEPADFQVLSAVQALGGALGGAGGTSLEVANALERVADKTLLVESRLKDLAGRELVAVTDGS